MIITFYTVKKYKAQINPNIQCNSILFRRKCYEILASFRKNGVD